MLSLATLFFRLSGRSVDFALAAGAAMEMAGVNGALPLLKYFGQQLLRKFTNWFNY